MSRQRNVDEDAEDAGMSVIVNGNYEDAVKSLFLSVVCVIYLFYIFCKQQQQQQQHLLFTIRSFSHPFIHPFVCSFVQLTEHSFI